MDAELRKQAETLAKMASLDRSGRAAEAARLAASRAFQVVRKQGADIVSSHNVCSTARTALSARRCSLVRRKSSQIRRPRRRSRKPRVAAMLSLLIDWRGLRFEARCQS